MSRVVVFLLLVAVLCPVRQAPAAEPAIRLEGGVFKLEGLPSPAGDGQWRERFLVYVDQPGVPPLLGSWRVENGSVVFQPRYPLQAGVRYRAEFRPPAGGAPLIRVFDLPPETVAPSTRVAHVFPSTDLLPENQLKLYLHFSAPMSRGEVWRRLRLLDEAGAVVQSPFLELEEELWDREAKRLTVLFDPGRIKRGLVPHNDVGPSIQEGRRYTLLIDSNWLDANGRPLVAEHRKTFRVGASDREPPTLGSWKLSTPSAGAVSPLVAEFPEPMEHALLHRLIRVLDARGHELDGEIGVDRQETRWRFTPARPWEAGGYQLLVGTILEDLAGNKIDRPFDVDVFERVQDRIRPETKSLPFTVRAGR